MSNNFKLCVEISLKYFGKRNLFHNFRFPSILLRFPLHIFKILLLCEFYLLFDLIRKCSVSLTMVEIVFRRTNHTNNEKHNSLTGCSKCHVAWIRYIGSD
jgi:hypothetical protein